MTTNIDRAALPVPDWDAVYRTGRPALVKHVAKAMCHASPEHQGWKYADARERQAWLALADAAITTIELFRSLHVDPLAAPEPHVVTSEQVEAAYQAWWARVCRDHGAATSSPYRGFIAGYTAPAPRATVTREQVAEVIASHIDGTPPLENVVTCSCGWKSTLSTTTRPWHEYREHVADAILALLNGGSDE